MLPTTLRCEACLTCYDFPDPSGRLYLYATEYDQQASLVAPHHLIAIPKKPVWCVDCNRPTFAEDLRELRDWDGAFALLKIGKALEFPFVTMENSDQANAIEEFKALYEIRLQRAKGRCLYCGGQHYVEVGNPDTGLRHEDCGGKLLRLSSIGSSLYSLSAYRIYATDGKLLGHLENFLNQENRYKVRQSDSD